MNRLSLLAVFCLGALTLGAQETGALQRDSAEAAERISKLRDFAKGHPERADEVEVYLFPLTREVIVPEEESAASVETPEARTMFLAKAFGGGWAQVRAESFEKDGDVLIITLQSGSKSIIQAEHVVAEVPWYSEEDISSGAVDREELAAKYEAAAVRAPGLAAGLRKEADRLRRMVERENARAEENAAEEREAIEEVTAIPFEAGTPVTEMVTRLQAAEKVIQEYPSAMAEIDEWAAPYREHMGHLLSGDEWDGKRWVTLAERQAKAEEEKSRAMRDALNYRLQTPALALTDIWDAARLPLGVALGTMIVSVAVIMLFRDSLLRLFAVFALVAAPVAGAFIFYLATRDPEGIPVTPVSAEESSLVDLVVAAQGGRVTTDTLQLGQDSVNAFLARRIRIAPASRGAVMPEGTALVLEKDGLEVFETVRTLGYEWTIRFQYAYLIDNGVVSLEPTGLWIGRLPCPKSLADRLRANLNYALDELISETKLVARFEPANPGEGTIELRPVTPVKSGEPAKEADKESAAQIEEFSFDEA